MDVALSTNKRPPKKHPLSFTINSLHNEVDPWPIEWMMFNVINEYLQPNSRLSADEAARCLDLILPENRPAEPDEEKEPPSVQSREAAENWMLELSELIWKMATQIPYDHEGQDKLVELLHELQWLPTTQTIENHEGDEMPAWDDIAGWHDSMRHAIGYPQKKKNPDQQTCDRYINASAFAARVHAARAQAPLSLYAFITIGKAVEALIPDEELLPCHLIAGSQWIILATDWLWRGIRWGKIDSHKLKSNGRKYMAFSPSRWVRWLRGFQNLAATGEGDDVRYWAGVAVDKMVETMRTKRLTAEIMEAWDPEKRSLWTYMWEDEKYAHLFKVPHMQKA